MGAVEKRENVLIINEDQKIFGIMHRPLNLSNYPAILICHGLGGTKTGHRRLYVKLAEQLAIAGIAALRIDFRGSGDSEGSFRDMTIDSEVSDALKALKYLEDDDEIDSKRLGIFGRSFGGVVGVLTASKYLNIKSFVLWAPVFNGDQWRDNWELLRGARLSPKISSEMMTINGQKPGLHFFEQLFSLDLTSPLAVLNSIPLLHIHGEKDELVSTSHATEFNKARNSAKAKSKFLLLPNTDHDFSNEDERVIALKESVDWFKKTLYVDSEEK
jgi:dipeptidyl aminopeptidase/acylaminoacyl peptidase